jgi:hypothetical protein
MRFIPTRVHGALDYVIGVVLIAAPWLLGFATGGPEQWVPVLIGVAIVVYSALTAYELGLTPLIPVPVHLTIDIVAGIVLALSPWLFGFAAVVVWPHLLVGLIVIGAGLTTETRPETARPAAPRATP